MKNHQFLEERLTEIVEIVSDLATKFERASRPAEETIMDDVALCELMHVSKRTTATWRATSAIPHSVIKGKIYYFYSDVLAFIKKYSVSTLDGSLKIKLSGRSN